MFVLMAAPRPIAPAVIVVNGQTGDDPGTCDLVEAIENANADGGIHFDCLAGSGDDEIQLTVDVILDQCHSDCTEAGLGLPEIQAANGAVTIEGAGHAITRVADESTPFRIFSIEPSASLTLNDVVVTGGLVSDPAAPSVGGGILNRRGVLTITNSTVSGNRAAAIDPFTIAYGGGIHNLGNATISHSTLSGNSAEVTGQTANRGHLAAGGGFSNCSLSCFGTYPSLSLSYSTISANTVSITPANATYSGGYGAGLYAVYGDVDVTNSTISSNTVYAYHPADANVAGGGISTTSNTLLLQNTTLSSNSVATAGDPYGLASGAGIEYLSLGAGDVTINASVVGNHPSGGNCAGIENATDGGGNLADDATCGTFADTLDGLDPLLADNGGATETHALSATSSALDAAGTCGLATDQRGVSRSDGSCDSGAFERLPCEAPDGDEVTVPDGIVGTEETFEACSLILAADVDVVVGGHLILRTAGRVELSNGFQVDADGLLTVEIDPGVTMPERF